MVVVVVLTVEKIIQLFLMASALYVPLSDSAMYALVAVILSLNCFIYAPVLLYLMHRMYQHRSVPYFANRHLRIIFVLVGSIVAYLVFVHSLRLLMFCIYSSKQPSNANYVVDMKDIPIPLLITVRCLWYSPFVFCVLLMIRGWLLYFDYKNALQIKAMKWRVHISEHEEEEHGDGDEHHHQHHHQPSLPWTLRYKFLASNRFIVAVAVIYTAIPEISVVVQLHYITRAECECVL